MHASLATATSRLGGPRSFGKQLAVAVLTVLLSAGVTLLLRSDSRSESVYYAHASWLFDVRDDRLLVGAADAVFFGVILASEPGPPLVADDSPEDSYPTTLYEVEPTATIKGRMVPPIAVVQLGGVDVDGSVRYFEGDSPLVVGREYLLVVAVNDPLQAEVELNLGTSVYELIAPGHDHEGVDSTAEREQLMDRYSSAHANQIDPYQGIE